MRQADVVIVGAGVAGLSAAMITAAHGARTLVLEQLVPGGQIAGVEMIGNVPGFSDSVAGYELGPLLQQQAERAGAIVELEGVSAISVEEVGYRIACSRDDILARAVIVAAGSSLRALDVPGERELAGRGISHCAACDGPLFKGQPVVVVGGGDSAFDEAAALASFASEVTVIHRGREPAARAAAVMRLTALDHVTTVADAEVTAIEGDRHVEAVTIRHGNRVERKACRAVFVYAGLEPRSQIVRDLVSLDLEGHIITDLMMRTSRPGVFAAGDVRAGSVKLLAAVAGDAATAAIGAIRYLRTNDENKNMIGQGDDLGAAERVRIGSSG